MYHFTDVRAKELRYLRYRKYLDAICVVLWATTPVLVAALTLGTHALRGQILDAPTVCTTLIYFINSFSSERYASSGVTGLGSASDRDPRFD